jgi:ubiquinone/menaquinone biosynthesis C-methylase UbiE
VAVTAATSKARYDGQADWYEQYNLAAAAGHRAEIEGLLGAGDGLCLDLGCGTGHYVEAIRATGRTVVGLDRSGDQLRIARTREDRLVHADAAALPFADGVFPTVAAFWVSSDVDDFAGVLREVARVLRPGGLLAVFGVHPCFNGPAVEFPAGQDSVTVHPTYRELGWHSDAPWWGENIRRRVGMRHMPLAELMNAIIDAGLSIGKVEEPGERPIPYALALRAYRSR